MILPETSAEKLLVAHGRVHGIRTGDKGRGRDGEQLANFEPGADLVAKVTVLAEGTQGHLTGVALDRFGLAGAAPAGLGARRQGGLEGREAAAPRDPHDGLAAPARRRATASSAARSSTRWATTCSRSGWCVGLDYRDAELSVARPAPGAEDASEDPPPARGRRARRLGREDDPERRLPLAAAAAARAGPAALRRRCRPREHPAAEGRPLRDRVGPARRRGRVRGRRAPAGRLRPRSPPTTTPSASSFIWSDLHEVRNMRQVFGRGLRRGRRRSRAR